MGLAILATAAAVAGIVVGPEVYAYCLGAPYNCVSAVNVVGDAALCVATNTCGTLPTGVIGREIATLRDATKAAARNLEGFSYVEVGIINEAGGNLSSSQMNTIRQAYKNGESVTVVINGRTIQYEPNLPASGMTMFGENGFLIGREAFANPGELDRTVLHELHRLTTSQSASGVSGSLATSETQAAFDFANRAFAAMNP